ncbi:DoxX family membrane protein [Arthrobacter globiformis]|uniref:DoxX family membrane protein n=1 Tax=Arthrobacter globiformis TaxID=1665 RepID=UPI0039792BDE
MKTTAVRESAGPNTLASDPARQAFLLLRTVFTVAPILFGLDKFTNLLTDWTGYLAPMVPDILHLPAQTVMYGVGVVEIVGGILVALRPRIGSLVVAAWLLGIILNLIILGAFFDVALRDFGLFVAALALNRLATAAAARQAGGTTVSH